MADYLTTGSTTPINVDPNVVAQLLGTLSGNASVEVVSGQGLNYTSTSPAVVIDNNANLNLSASVATTVAAGSGSTIDFSGSVAPDGTPVPLTVYTSGFSKVILNAGANFVQSYSTNDTIRSGGGPDTLVGGLAATKLVAGGQSQIQGSTGGGDTILAGLTSNSQDTITSSGNSLIRAGQGQNVISGGAGDTIRAGASQSFITAGSGSTISGGQGASVFSGGDSLLRGGQGNSYSLKGGDTLMGGQGDNSATIGRGTSVEVDGGKGTMDVTVRAGGGIDTLFGGSGGLTVHTGARMGSVTSDVLDQNDPTIHHLTFSNGQQMVTGGVTIEFTNGKTYNA